MSKCNFFISYSQRDGRELGREIAAQLTKKGYTVFFDEEVVAGYDWQEPIKNAIANCDYFVPIVTEGYFSSASLRMELESAVSVAQDRATQVIPVSASDMINYPTSILSLYQHVKYNSKFDIQTAAQDVADKLEKIAGQRFKTNILYEKLAEYKSLNNKNKEAETICQLMSLVRSEYDGLQTEQFSKIWKTSQQLLGFYEQLSAYVGDYDEASRRVAAKIIKELDKTQKLLIGPRRRAPRIIFTSHIILCCVAIRIIYLDREIRLECEDILSGGENINPCPVADYYEMQRPFAAVYHEGGGWAYNDEWEERAFLTQQNRTAFIEETYQYIIGDGMTPITRINENDIYNTLVKYGYNVDKEVKLDRYTVDMAIKKGDSYVLYIEYCSSTPSSRETAYQEVLKKHIESIGGKLFTIYDTNWENNPRDVIRKIKEMVDTCNAQEDEILVSIAKFVEKGNKLFDVFQKNGVNGDFLECLRESYERLKNYCVVVGATDVAAKCAERIVEIRNEIDKPSAQTTDNEKASNGIKSLLGLTLEDSGKYDVFISFKNEDADLAEKIYTYCHEHMKVPFWSKKSLPKLSESEYSRAIDAALDSSRHFVVVFSKLEYLEAEWIRYEMDVFNNEIKEGRKKSSNFVIVVTDDVYNEIIRSNKTVLNIAYRRYQIIKMSEFGDTLAQYLS